MKLLNWIYQILRKNDSGIGAILADWLEENRKAGLELEWYLKKLRKSDLILGTLIDIGIKFGEKKERRIMANVKRALIRIRGRGTFIGKIDVCTKDGRKRIRRYNQNQVQNRSHKRIFLARLKRIRIGREGIVEVRVVANMLATYFLSEGQ